MCRCVERNGRYHEPLDTLQSLQWHRPEKAGNEARGILMPIAPQLQLPVTGSGKFGGMVAVEFERVWRDLPPQRSFIKWNYVLTCSTVLILHFVAAEMKRVGGLGIGVVTAGLAHRHSGDSGLPGRIEASACSASCTCPGVAKLNNLGQSLQNI